MSKANLLYNHCRQSNLNIDLDPCSVFDLEFGPVLWSALDSAGTHPAFEAACLDGAE